MREVVAVEQMRMVVPRKPRTCRLRAKLTLLDCVNVEGCADGCDANNVSIERSRSEYSSFEAR